MAGEVFFVAFARPGAQRRSPAIGRSAQDIHERQSNRKQSPFMLFRQIRRARFCSGQAPHVCSSANHPGICWFGRTLVKKEFLTSWWTGEYFPRHAPSSNCKGSFSLENRILRRNNPLAPAVHAAGCDLALRGLRPFHTLPACFNRLTTRASVGPGGSSALRSERVTLAFRLAPRFEALPALQFPWVLFLPAPLRCDPLRAKGATGKETPSALATVR